MCGTFYVLIDKCLNIVTGTGLVACEYNIQCSHVVNGVIRSLSQIQGLEECWACCGL